MLQCSSTRVQTEISQQILDGISWNIKYIHDAKCMNADASDFI